MIKRNWPQIWLYFYQLLAKVNMIILLLGLILPTTNNLSFPIISCQPPPSYLPAPTPPSPQDSSPPSSSSTTFLAALHCPSSSSPQSPATSLAASSLSPPSTPSNLPNSPYHTGSCTRSRPLVGNEPPSSGPCSLYSLWGRFGCGVWVER